MWNDYYDEVVYTEKTDRLDKSGSIMYKEPRTISVRCVSGGESYVTAKEDTSIKYTKEYQVPFMLHEGDKIDDRVVVSVEAAKDVFGQFHFCIAKVE
jgi:hypothetical protein